MTKLKENRIERFKEEKSEYEADIRNDEENYLNDDLEKVDEDEAVASEDSSSDDSDNEDNEQVNKPEKMDQSEADSESDDKKEYDSDDEIGKVKRRKKKKAKNFSDSEDDDEDDDIPQPFSNQESMASSINPYRNMSRLVFVLFL